MVHVFFLILRLNIDCEYSLEPPQRGGTDEDPQSMIWAKQEKKSSFSSSENHHFYKL